MQLYLREGRRDLQAAKTFYTVIRICGTHKRQKQQHQTHNLDAPSENFLTWKTRKLGYYQTYLGLCNKHPTQVRFNAWRMLFSAGTVRVSSGSCISPRPLELQTRTVNGLITLQSDL